MGYNKSQRPCTKVLEFQIDYTKLMGPLLSISFLSTQMTIQINNMAYITEFSQNTPRTAIIRSIKIILMKIQKSNIHTLSYCYILDIITDTELAVVFIVQPLFMFHVNRSNPGYTVNPSSSHLWIALQHFDASPLLHYSSIFVICFVICMLFHFCLPTCYIKFDYHGVFIFMQFLLCNFLNWIHVIVHMQTLEIVNFITIYLIKDQ